jgi:hypothetical protein
MEIFKALFLNPNSEAYLFPVLFLARQLRVDNWLIGIRKKAQLGRIRF